MSSEGGTPKAAARVALIWIRAADGGLEGRTRSRALRCVVVGLFGGTPGAGATMGTVVTIQTGGGLAGGQ